jgi:outer membrane protein assembly factor BamB
MKKISLLSLIFVFFGSCSFFSSRAPTYPSGVFFPLEKAGEIVYEGQVIDCVDNVGGHLYLSTGKGFVYCLDGAESKIIWKFEASEPLASPLFFGPDNIYVYDQSNTIYCLNSKGELLWKRAAKEKISSGIGEFNRKIFFGTEQGSLFALNAASGEELWSFKAEGAIRTTPVFSEYGIIFGCDDHSLYILGGEGGLVSQVRAQNKIQTTPSVDKNFLYFGSDDHYFYCFNLKRKKMKWKIKTGGKISTQPVTDGKKIFFLCLNNVLYCLNKKNGHILWWKIIPSRSFYRLEISGDSIVVSSLSSLLVCFDRETGEKAGEYDAGQEVRSNPIWLSPYLAFNLFDSQNEQGRLFFLKRVISVTLTSSLTSPQPVGKEISFKASSVGFYLPKYEFYLKEGNERRVVQAKSEKESCVWFPEKEGNYFIGVEVFDERQSQTAEILFVIRKN